MLNSLTIAVQNFVRKIRKLAELLTVEFLVLKTAIFSIAIGPPA